MFFHSIVTPFFVGITGVLLKKYNCTISSYNLLRLPITNIHWANERKWFHTFKKRVKTRRYPAELLTGVDKADDLGMFIDIFAKVESFFHWLELAVRYIGLYMNDNKNEFISFKLNGAILSLNGKSLKFVDRLLPLSNYISSRESDFYTLIGKIWTITCILSNYRNYLFWWKRTFSKL